MTLDTALSASAHNPNIREMSVSLPEAALIQGRSQFRPAHPLLSHFLRPGKAARLNRIQIQ
jgi:hypothetical protein